MVLTAVAIEAPSKLVVHRSGNRCPDKAVISLLSRVFRLDNEKRTGRLNMKIYKPDYEKLLLNILPILTYSRYLTVIRTTIMFIGRLNYLC
jgi:hypothetical protein